MNRLARLMRLPSIQHPARTGVWQLGGGDSDAPVHGGISCSVMSAIDNESLRLRNLLREMCGRSTGEFWRKLARPVTFFDEHSPASFSEREIGEFFRKWRARPAFALCALRRAKSTHAPSRRSSPKFSASGGGWRARQGSNLRPSA